MRQVQGIRMTGFLRCASALVLSAAALCAQASGGSARIDRASLDALRGTAPGAQARVILRWQSTTIAGREVATQDVATTLRRIEVYASDARVLEATADGYRELPRDARLHFVAVGTTGQRLGLSLDADSGAAEGLLMRDGRMFALDGQAAADGLLLSARDLDAPLADGDVAVSSCAGNQWETPGGPKTSPSTLSAADAAAPLDATRALQARSFAPKVATRQVTVAVDTDNEFLLRKFANNTANATAYLAALFTALNAIYEDDPAAFGLQLRLLQGTVILRPSTTADPFNNTDTTASGAALTEFGGWWRNNQSGVARAFALLLSGKSSNQNSASGIAWLVTSGIYCTSTGSGGQNFGHYSVNQVFWNPGLAASQDAYLVAHELGHNLGANHTHCANATTGAQASTNTIDRCFNGESSFGCYAGPQSCPTAQESPTSPQGSLMSYCHLNGLGCGVSTEFHPTHVTQLNGRLSSQPSTCVAPIGSSTNAAPTITAPASYSGTEDQTLTINGTSFADSDAGSGSLTATFSVPSGAVTASASSGVTIGGSGSARTLAGTLASINGLLSAGRLSYAPVVNANGTINLSIAINDNGNTGGAAQSASRSVPMNIAAVNDAPTASVPASVALSEDQSSAIAGINVADVDVGAGNLQLSFGVPAGSIAATGNPLITVGGSATARTITGTPGNLNGFIATGGVTYAGAANANGTVTLTVSVNDLGNSGGGAQEIQPTIALQIAAVNDAPSVTAPAAVAVTAGQSVGLPGVIYADPDAPGGNINMTATYTAGSGTFSASSAGGVTVSGSGTTTLTLSGTLSAINNLVASVPVQYNASAIVSGIVPLTLSIDDQGNIGGGALGASRVVNATVMAADVLFMNGFE